MSRRTGTKRVVPRFIYVESETTLGSQIVLGGLPLANFLVARAGSFFASSHPTLPFTSTLLFRMRCNRVRRFLSEYPAFDFQLLTFNLPARGFPRPDSRSQSIQTFTLTTFT